MCGCNFEVGRLCRVGVLEVRAHVAKKLHQIFNFLRYARVRGIFCPIGCDSPSDY